MKTSTWSRVGLIVAALFLGASLAHAQSDELLVYQVQAAQLPGTASVDVWYRLHTVGGDPVAVRLYLSTDSGASYPYLCQSVTGDVGPGVLPGADRHIVWDAGTDFPGFDSTTCRVRVTAYDGEDLDGFATMAPGVFTMGSPTDEPGRLEGETQHQVTLTHGCYVQITEVTNQQYMELAQWAYDHGHATATNSELRDNLDGSTQILKRLGPGNLEISFSNGVFSCINADHPVKYVTWYGAAAYCDWLSLQQGLLRAYDHGTWQCNGGNPYAAAGYRLPTEAEWEYACRAGSGTAFANGPITQVQCDPIDPNLDEMGWYCGNTGGLPGGWTRPVAQKLPNAWGLYDMHGNLYEWCNDWYGTLWRRGDGPRRPAHGRRQVGPWR